MVNTNICVRVGFIKDLDDQGAGLLTQWRVLIGGFTVNPCNAHFP